MLKIIGDIFRGIRDIIYPETCVVCGDKPVNGSIDGAVCLKCWNGIRKNVPPFCPRCGRSLQEAGVENGTCRECRSDPPCFDRAFSACVYEGVVKDLIHKFKYNGKDHLAKPLGRILTEFIRDYSIPLDRIDLIVPVPLHPAKFREREFNQAQLLGAEIAKTFKKEISTGNLIRRRYTKSQAGLESQQRADNVKDSFAVKNPGLLKGKNILLVDDVMTTTATSSEAGKALKNAGAKTVIVLTLAD